MISADAIKQLAQGSPRPTVAVVVEVPEEAKTAEALTVAYEQSMVSAPPGTTWPQVARLIGGLLAAADSVERVYLEKAANECTPAQARAVQGMINYWRDAQVVDGIERVSPNPETDDDGGEV